MSEEKKNKGYLIQAWLVVMLATVFGAALAGVHVGLSDRIEQNKKDETLKRIPALVGVKLAAKDVLEVEPVAAPGAAGPPSYKVLVNGEHKLTIQKVRADDTKDALIAYSTFKPSGEPAGWVIKGDGQGFADRIELLIGLDAQLESLTGLYVLDQKETPGLGNKIKDDDWRERFEKKKATVDVVVVKSPASGNEVQAVTGATVSSSSVAKIVNIAVIEFRNDYVVRGKYGGRTGGKN